MLASLNPPKSSPSLPNHVSRSVAMMALARPQPSMPAQDETSSIKRFSSKEHVATRGHSDSAIMTCRSTRYDEHDLSNLGGPLQKDQAVPFSLPEDRNGHIGSVLGAQHSMPLHVKARENLHLPCFKMLGISSRLPDALLTPPDETIINLGSTAPPSSLIPRSSSYPPPYMPKTPSPDRPEFHSIPGNQLSTNTATSSEQPQSSSIESLEKGEKQATESASSGSENGDPGLVPAGWLVNVINAAGELLLLSIQYTFVKLTTLAASLGSSANNTIYVLCHSQPCPLPNTAMQSEAMTAFNGLMIGIQNRIVSGDHWIHVTHAVPVKFNMGQIPNSPATTPSVHNTGAASTDYFSLPTNVFANAVVAVGHQDALNSAVPSSPHPVVPPASVNISLLERFIPPPSAEEYLNLFTAEGPSVLVDRLIELSSNGGSLIFIYPTAAGANAFANIYLGPLIHPLLRTMCSIHNLSMDFGAGVGSIAAIDRMQSFEDMSRKIQLVLRKLGRQTSSIHRQPPKFTLVQSSKHRVDLDRKAWTEWWAQQETPRMRTVVDRYLKRGSMLPTRIGGQDVTAATLVQEVLDGVKEGRKYADYDAKREGVEVGIFVIKRTA